MKKYLLPFAAFLFFLAPQAHAAITIVQSSTLRQFGGTPTISVSSTPARGDLILIEEATVITVVTPPSGFTQLAYVTSTDGQSALNVWYKVAGASESNSYAFSSFQPDWENLIMYDISGENEGHPIDQWSWSKVSGSPSSITTATTTPTNLNDFAIAFNTGNLNNSVSSLSSGWTNYHSFSSAGGYHGDSDAIRNSLTNSTSTGISVTFTMSGTDNYETAQALIEPLGTYQYYRSITVTSTGSVASGTNSNFPMLVSSTLSSWASSAHGGKIQNLITTSNGIQEAADLIFATSTANCNTDQSLNFETESYNSSTGAVVDWVNVPTMSTGTLIYACYDSTSTSADQSSPNGTWNSNYVGAWHMNDNAANTTVHDSTGNLNNGISSENTSVRATSTGEIDGALDFVSTVPDTIDFGEPTYFTNNVDNMSASVWFNPTATAFSNTAVVFGQGQYAASGWGYLEPLASGKVQVTIGGQGGWTYYNSNATLSANTWVYMTFTETYEGGSNALISFFINGVLDSTTTANGPYLRSDGGNHLYAGRYGGGGYNYDGILDETELSSVALTPSWILTEYNNQVSPATFYSIGSETAFGGGGSTNYDSLFLFYAD